MKNTYLLLAVFLLFSCQENNQEYQAENFEISSPPDQVVLTWQQDPSTTMTITWRTEQPVKEAVLRYSESPAAPAEKWPKKDAVSFTFSQTTSWLHTIELTQLKPDKEYHVVIEHPVSPQEFFFRTMPAKRNQREIMFLAGGDSRSRRDVRREMNRLAAQQDPDFVVFAGDFNDSSHNEQQWNEWFDDWHELLVTYQGRRIPIVPAIGNHEVAGGYLQTRNEAPFFYHRFITPEPRNYYILEFGPDLAIITLDSDHTREVSQQNEWLDNTLQSLEETRWKIVQYHVTAWPGVRSFDADIPTKIRENWVPLFEKHNVNLVVEGHDHAFKKTVPIKNNKEDESGVIYIGDGAWGAPLREVKDPEKHWWLEEALSADHFWKITLSKDGESLKVEPVFRPLVNAFVLQAESTAAQ